MDKKELAALLADIVTKVAENNELSEAEARTFVGVALRRNKEDFVASVSVPTLTVS
ncbi:hypothetical protein N9045_01825 [bacterium]|nr:hypothetical protein [bacterium]